MANSQMKVVVFVTCLIAMAVFVSAHDGHHHAEAPSPMMKKGGGDTGASSSLAPFSALMVGLVGFAFSFARA
ncbi:hypothetical protein SOVF_198760 [Spinacia oleracea]|nr:hypothetical protein SOVF_198760 [Spinacia oleracea]